MSWNNKAISSNTVNSAPFTSFTAQASKGCQQKHFNMYTSLTTPPASQMADRKLPRHFLEMSWCNKASSSDTVNTARFTSSAAQASKGCQQKHLKIYKSPTTAHAPEMADRKLPRHFLEISW
jgi:hypothetical protein